MAKPNSIGFATPVSMEPENQRVLMANASLGTKFWLEPPFGPPGTIIPLPETWAVWPGHDDICNLESCRAKYLFKADGRSIGSSSWRSPALAPAEAVRLHIEVINVWYERLSDMTEESLLKEGICRNVDPAGRITFTAPSIEGDFLTPAAAYLALWQQSYGPQSMTRDPWIWVTEFKISADTAPAELLPVSVSTQVYESISCG